MIKIALVSDIHFINETIKEVNGQPFTNEYLKYMIENNELYTVFIIDEVGFIILWHDNNFAEVVEFGISSNSQNKGLGKTLLKYSIEYLSNKNIEQISLEVRKSNKIAIHLYESFNFKYDKTIPNYYVDEDALVYRWFK